MKSDDLRKLQPFVRLIAQARSAYRVDFGGCRCRPVDGRYSDQCAECRQATPACRLLTDTAARAMLAQLHLPQAHLSASEVEQAVADLHAVTLDLPRLDAEAFKERVVQAVQMRRAEGRASR